MSEILVDIGSAAHELLYEYYLTSKSKKDFDTFIPIKDTVCAMCLKNAYFIAMVLNKDITQYYWYDEDIFMEPMLKVSLETKQDELYIDYEQSQKVLEGLDPKLIPEYEQLFQESIEYLEQVKSRLDIDAMRFARDQALTAEQQAEKQRLEIEAERAEEDAAYEKYKDSLLTNTDGYKY